MKTTRQDVSRSAPDIKAAAAVDEDSVERPQSPDADGLKRRAESEPNLAKNDDQEPT